MMARNNCEMTTRGGCVPKAAPVAPRFSHSTATSTAPSRRPLLEQWLDALQRGETAVEEIDGSCLTRLCAKCGPRWCTGACLPGASR
jgi:hypothetical protein